MTWKIFTKDMMEITGRISGNFNQETLNIPATLSIREDWIRVYRWNGTERN